MGSVCLFARLACTQIEEEASKFASAMGYRTLPLVGGGGIRSIEEQGFQMGQVGGTHPTVLYRHSGGTQSKAVLDGYSLGHFRGIPSIQG
jgi:hypothetical protein